MPENKLWNEKKLNDVSRVTQVKGMEAAVFKLYSILVNGKLMKWKGFVKRFCYKSSQLTCFVEKLLPSTVMD